MWIESIHDFVCSVFVKFCIGPVGNSGAFARVLFAVIEAGVDCFLDEREVFVRIEDMLVCLNDSCEPIGCELFNEFVLVIDGSTDMVEKTRTIAGGLTDGQDGVISAILSDFFGRAADDDELG